MIMVPKESTVCFIVFLVNRYYYGVVSMHNQKRTKRLSAKTRLPPWIADHIDFTDINTENTPAIAGH